MSVDINDLKRICKLEINSAGARYTPHVEAGAPNIQISNVLDAVDALSVNESARIKLENLTNELKEVWKNPTEIVQKLFKNRKQTPIYLAEVLESLRNSKPGSVSKELTQLYRAIGFVSQKLNNKRRELIEIENRHENSDGSNKARLSRRKIEEILDVVGIIQDYINTSIPKLFQNNCALLKGEWGTGKTHTLADITEQRILENKPTVFVLGYHFAPDIDPLAQICNEFNLNGTKRELLNLLQSGGESIDERSLIIIDGINEGDSEGWSRAIGILAEEIVKYPNIGLILSCRTPYDQFLFTPRERKKYEIINHYGFTDNEIDAQKVFFKYYDIPLPQVPLLNPEFSRPLFLKLFCKAIEKRSKRTKREKIRELANGQKGMTYLFEYFTKNVGESIEDDYNLNYKTCWYLIKGIEVSDTGFQGIAVTMAEKGRRYVTYPEAEDIILNITSITNRQTAKELINRMANQGLLLKDLKYNDGRYNEVIRLPYQRFSDHVIARYLLYKGNYLNKTTKESIKKSFYENRPLGKIFSSYRYKDSFSDPGLASALMLEFPEAVKNTLPENERELITYIPKKRRFFKPIAESFLDGLIWRNIDSFSEQTGRIIQILLDKSDEYYLQEVFEVLVTLASRPEHPYNASWLLDHLRKQSIPKRDLEWSEFLRRATQKSTVIRLLAWVEQIDINKLDNKTVSNLVILLSLMLTTTYRERRDRVTRALFLIGNQHSKKLFEQTIKSLNFNDPYVPERMLASAYGVVMNSWSDKNRKEFKQNIGVFAKSLYEKFFAPGAAHASHHTLMKNYASGIVEVARKVERYCIANQFVQYTTPPFNQIPSPFPEASSISQADVEDAKHAIHMDFGNYTIGRLIKDRSNYDYEHQDYKKVRRQIEWRILDLGYSSTIFKEIDQQLGRRNFSSSSSGNASKIDRYGKKYSWIAYFEMYGLLEDLKLLPEYIMEHRTSDCDIDPSFPIYEYEWLPKLPDLFTDHLSNLATWLKCDAKPDYRSLYLVNNIEKTSGTWVLLDGFIEQGNKDGRRIFTFLRGLFVNLAQVKEIKSKTEDIIYLGNDKIPEPLEDYYTFFGEIPWSCRFGSYLRKNNCNANRDLREVLRDENTEIIKKHIDKLNEDEQSHLKTQLQIQNLPGLSNTNRELIDKNGMVTLFQRRSIPGIEAEIPICQYIWGSSRSELNQIGNIDFPAPAICEALNLVHIGQSLDLYDKNNKKAYLFRFGKKEEEYNFNLAYLRKDLLEDYLIQTNQTLIWIDWGERTLQYYLLNALSRDSKEQELINNFENIHREIISFDEVK